MGDKTKQNPTQLTSWWGPSTWHSPRTQKPLKVTGAEQSVGGQGRGRPGRPGRSQREPRGDWGSAPSWQDSQCRGSEYTALGVCTGEL